MADPIWCREHMLYTESNQILKKTYQRALLPNVLAVLGGTVNVFCDSMMVGRKLGDSGIAAVNQSLPVYLLLCTLGSCLAAGAMAMAGYELGNHRGAEGKRICCAAIEWLVILGILLTGMGVWLSPRLAGILGSAGTYAYVEQYIRITFIGSLWKMLLYIPVYFLRLQGKMKQISGMTFFMAVCNILLDYLFLFQWDRGISGAAWASVIATAFAALLGFIFLSGRDSDFHFALTGITGRDVLAMAQRGSPVAANNLFSAIRLLLLGTVMKRAGGSSLVTVFAVTNSVSEISICVQNGIPQTGMAMLGIMAGEKDVSAIRMLQNMQIKYGIRYATGMEAGIIIFAGNIGSIFGSTEDIRLPLILFAWSLIPATLNNVMSYYYFALKRTRQADMVSLFRIIFFAAASAWLLSGCSHWIFLFYPVSECLTMVWWLLADRWHYKNNPGLSPFYLLDEHLEQEGQSISFTIPCDAKLICETAQRIEDFCRHNGFTPGQQNAISLSLEEILVIISEKSLGWQGTIDVRVLCEGGGGILRFRSAGKQYNPLDLAERGHLDYLGIRMIAGMAKRVEYQSTLGLNTLLVEI